MNLPLSAELELLLLCSRMHLDSVHAKSIHQALMHAPNWDRLLELGQRHGLTPLLYRTFDRLKPSRVPHRVLAKLRTQADAIRLRSLVMTSELLRAMRALDNAGIVAVPYKGPALAAFLLGDVGLRHCADLDLLVRPRDALKAMKTLEEHEFTIERRTCQRVQALWVQVHYETNLYSLDSQIRIELHWRLAPRYWPLPDLPASAWNRLETLPLTGAHLPWLAPEDLLYVLCLHGCKDRWNLLKWVVDVAEVIRIKPNLDWNRLMHTARGSGAERMVRLAALLAHELLGAELRPDVLDTVRSDPKVSALATDVYKNLQTEQQLPNKGNSETIRFLAKAADRVATRIHFLALIPAYFFLHHIVGPGQAAYLRLIKR